MTGLPPLQVLLATYNGERFLREQIDSLLAQTYQPIVILARDDGSSDATPAILREYAGRWPERFSILPTGLPAGSAQGNFLRLLQAAHPGPVAFSDQDDVWLPDKIKHEMQLMAELEREYGIDQPLLVFSDLRVVDERLSPIAPSLWRLLNIAPENSHRLSRLLAQNVVTGCTAVLNARLVQLARCMPPEVYIHDWWVGAIAALLGRAAYLREPLVLYRQHGANTLGAMHTPPTGIPKWRQHGERRRRWEISVQLAEALLESFGDLLRPADRDTLEALLRCERNPNRLARVATFLRRGFFARGLRVNMAMLWYLWDMKFAKQN